MSITLGAAGYGLYRTVRRRKLGDLLLLGVGLTLVAVFVLSRFGTDSTGRYFLPLAVPLALWTGRLLSKVVQEKRWVGEGLLAALLVFNLLGNFVAVVQNPPGLTTQFDPSNRFDNQYDDELMAFLHQVGGTRGYSNYFVAFRIAFLSQEEILLSSQLPYKPDFSYNRADDRYPAYTDAVQAADEVVYITSIHPDLDARLAAALQAAQVEFQEADIGPYHIFYRLDRPIEPQALGFGHP